MLFIDMPYPDITVTQLDDQHVKLTFKYV